MMRSALLLLALTVLGSARAQAQAVAPVESAAPRSAPDPAPSSVAWSNLWPRFRLWEYAGTAAVFGVSFYVRFHEPLPDHAKWTGHNPFDDELREWLRARTPQGRQRASDFSDWVSLAGTAMPYAVDLPVALLVHRQFVVTWQLAAMDLEANAVAGFIDNLSYFTVGRARPSSADCVNNPGYDVLCGGTGNNASFPSGHTLTIATATGLTCVHHHYLPLYGSTAADRAACVVMAVATAATATARIMSDRHFASDALFGAVVGFGSGYGLPWLLHYRAGLHADPAVDKAPHVAVIPLASPTSLGLGLAGEL